jgi:SAM-dependent methyltransferase
MLQRIKRATPPAVKRLLKRALPPYRRLHCPLCGARAAEFLPFGLVKRANAKCPTCGSLERHRFLWLFFQQRTDLFKDARKTMLHFAPEPTLVRRLSDVANLLYVTADLLAASAMVKVDITEMPFAKETFDVLCCSHVLEHVPDDRKAMRECLRVLKPDGWAVFLVPVTVQVTFEDPTISDPAERERLFGQRDHVRRYGLDVITRLEQAGFEVATYYPHDIGGALAARHAIPEQGSPILFCRRKRL